MLNLLALILPSIIVGNILAYLITKHPEQTRQFGLFIQNENTVLITSIITTIMLVKTILFAETTKRKMNTLIGALIVSIIFNGIFVYIKFQ
jgi:hypothetical protein